MPLNPLIAIDLPGEPAGVPGEARVFPYSKIGSSAVTVTLSLGSTVGITSYLWEILDQPIGATAVLSDPAAPAPTFDATQAAPGSYLIRCIGNNGVASTTNGVAFTTENKALRAPAAGEKTEFDAVDGWKTSLNEVINETDLGVSGALQYQGTWNASTNTPTLVSSTGTTGHYYVVSVAGTTDLDGITDWQIGDWAVFNGSVWEKVDNTQLFYWNRTGSVLSPENSGDSLKLDAAGAAVDIIRDEDDMISDDPAALATQQSIKKYVDDSIPSVFWNRAGSVLSPLTAGDRVEITIADTENAVPLSLIQNDSTNDPDVLSIENAGSGDAIAFSGGGSHKISSTATLEIESVAVSIDASAASNFTVSGATADLTLGARAATITLNESDETTLDGAFTATSIVGALNELKGEIVAESLWNRAASVLSPQNAGDGLSVDATTAIDLESDVSSGFAVSGSDAGDLTLFLDAANAGAGDGIISINADSVESASQWTITAEDPSDHVALKLINQDTTGARSNVLEITSNPIPTGAWNTTTGYAISLNSPTTYNIISFGDSNGFFGGYATATSRTGGFTYQATGAGAADILLATIGLPSASGNATVTVEGVQEDGATGDASARLRSETKNGNGAAKTTVQSITRAAGNAETQIFSNNEGTGTSTVNVWSTGNASGSALATVEIRARQANVSSTANSVVQITANNAGSGLATIAISAQDDINFTARSGSITLNESGETILSGFSATSLIGALNELKSEIPFPDYAGIFVKDNSTSTSITLANSWFKFTLFDTNLPDEDSVSDQANDRVTIGATRDYSVSFSASGESAVGNKTFEYSVFEVSSTETLITGATQANPVVVTASGHGLSNGQKVAIKSVGGMTEISDRIFTVANVTASTFELQDDNSTNIDGTGFTAYTGGGTAAQATELTAHVKRLFAAGGAGDFGAFGSDTIASLTSGNHVELYISGLTDTTNFTIEDINLKIERL